MKTLLLSIFIFSLSTSSLFAYDLAGATVSKTKPEDVDIDFQTSYFQSKPWIKEFHYVVVVNKATSGRDTQTIKVYEYENLILSGNVSTGRDEFEAAGEHHAKKDTWSVTPTGYYTPDYLDKNHKSDTYGGKLAWLIGGTKMPYAIFFNGGIALHQAPKGTEPALGTKASGGCIRLQALIAEDLFNRIKETKGSRIPKFKLNGAVELDSYGNYAYTDAAFSALIIVIDKVL